jgi:hypothetical protein
MFHRNASSRRHSLIAGFFALIFMLGQPQVKGQDTSPGIDFFAGVNLSMIDMDFKRQYDVLIHLTPGFKWNMGDHWQLSGKAMIPVVNTYGDQYKYVQIGALNISKELCLSKLYLKTSLGVFDNYRYGADMKAFVPFSDKLAFEAQVGYVGVLYFDSSPHFYGPETFVWTVGGDIYLPRWNTQFRGIVGRYLFQDFGCEAEAMRHFNHTTVSLYGRWSGDYGLDGGFRIVIMIPPYHRKHRVVNFRPASNFRVSYSTMNHSYSNCMYHTDPEENERDGWFSRDLLHWGSHTMEPDFIITNQSDQQ